MPLRHGYERDAAGALQIILTDAAVDNSYQRRGVAVSPEDFVYCYDATDGLPAGATVFGGVAFTSDKKVCVTTTAPSGQKKGAQAIAVDGNGSVWITGDAPAAKAKWLEKTPIGPVLVRDDGALHVGISFFVKFTDAGSGIANIAAVFGGVNATFTRATAGWTKLSTGLWAEVASGSPRSFYGAANNTVAGAYAGYLAEGARTNLALQSRDMAQADWVKVNTTATKTATGIDGVVNSASRVTATSNGGTILQTLVAAATSRTYSVWLRRVTGTGTITIQQGATTLDVTASLNSTTYTRVELNASVLNSAYGIIFATSGDAVDADMNGFEAGAFASSPIPTTTATVTRNADVLTYPTTGWLNEAAGSILVTGAAFTDASTTTSTMMQIDDGTQDNRHTAVRASGAANLATVVGGVVQANPSGGSWALATVGKQGYDYATNDFIGAFNGATFGADTSGTVPTSLITLRVGMNASAAAFTFGTISSIRYWPSRLPNATLQALTA